MLVSRYLLGSIYVLYEYIIIALLLFLYGRMHAFYCIHVFIVED